jgi:LemA protein
MIKKSWIIIGVLVLLGIILYSTIKGTYNGLVNLEETVNKSWADVQGAYQRRADLIPNLVNTVKGYANHEQQTLIKVIEERAKATQTQINVDPAKLDEASLAKFQKAQDEIGSSLSRLLVSVEQYPDLKANENFLQLQAQLEGTENRINVERRNFNEAVNGYNKKLRSFPTNLLAGMFGFEKKPYFQAQAGAEDAPKVEF